jgi:hypothetical protein
MIEPKTHTIEQPGASREEVARALEQTIPRGFFSMVRQVSEASSVPSTQACRQKRAMDLLWKPRPTTTATQD